MPNQYRWEITSIDVVPELDGHTNVVQCIHWRRVATDDNGREEYLYDAIAVAFDSDSEFIDYANLTQGDVISWLEGVIGQKRISEMDSALDERLNPAVPAPPLPWVVA